MRRASGCAPRPAALTTASNSSSPASRPENRTCQDGALKLMRSTAVSNAIMPPRSWRSPHSASMKPWLSMMPVSGDHSAPMQDNSPSMARAALPPIICVFSTPFLSACARMVSTLASSASLVATMSLPHFLVRDAVTGTEFVQHPPAAHAVMRARAVGRIIQAAVNHLAVARGDAVGDAARRFGNGDIVPAQRRFTRDREPDDAGADHKDLHEPPLCHAPRRRSIQ